jgi:hypothetical protein
MTDEIITKIISKTDGQYCNHLWLQMTLRFLLVGFQFRVLLSHVEDMRRLDDAFRDLPMTLDELYGKTIERETRTDKDLALGLKRVKEGQVMLSKSILMSLKLVRMKSWLY